MTTKKRPVGKKKFVSFSDDDALSRTGRLPKNLPQHGSPPVYVRRTWQTIPFHLIVLSYWFIKHSNGYDVRKCTWLLVPCQVLYLALQFNPATVYGNKILKLNYALLAVSGVTCILLTIPCMLLVVLFGAPFLEMLDKTWLLSLHCCVLSYPAVYSVLNSDFKVGFFKKYFISIAVGCWISCLAIPLDWDRPWQEWPIPLVVGAQLGAMFGYTFCSQL
ncbi:AAL059Wp [Eremothecium gossypii ATCC 10895]|uniref:Glycosylphosphatidylinositol anchor biosynthesis protein 11 n=1 Tax=Eremothecium gossypii (strain ATCC 10895 / CBS 109.51 / FGSC 9923 / NRRL Y-1056) TaxID=284811 RepID=GPI11_EREGS|nr:AAL059Wp [Eremothecium gossypii ATCC 10895]Q75EY7.1 RecName: Full=Glycosylphosphatidylinositol anchor biosynthesis protein 11 [Eremothecium gossypii ATCC 10895]AAS50307.1 AAL059Wp [Eremothecium gossypii ATCC 10895]AEY94593.1 FAAL059Wp [Eremothecium gossypii FDAG1]